MGSIIHKTHKTHKITESGCNVLVHLAPVEVGNATRSHAKSSTLQKGSKHVKRSSEAMGWFDLAYENSPPAIKTHSKRSTPVWGAG